MKKILVTPVPVPVGRRTAVGRVFHLGGYRPGAGRRAEALRIVSGGFYLLDGAEAVQAAPGDTIVLPMGGMMILGQVLLESGRLLVPVVPATGGAPTRFATAPAFEPCDPYPAPGDEAHAEKIAALAG